MNTEQELKRIFGNNVKSQRERKGWTQEFLAEKANVSSNTISDIETGQKFARAKTLVSLADAFGTQVYELLKPNIEMPDKPVDILIKYGEEIKEKVEEIGDFYIKRMME